MLLREQLKAEMLKQNMAQCDVVEFVINPHKVITCYSSDDPQLWEDIQVEEIRLYSRYEDYIRR